MQLDQIQILQLEISSHCNAKCPQCPRFDINGELRGDLILSHWDTAFLKNIQIEKLTNLKWVQIEGDKGDPLMHPDIEKIISYFVNAPSKPIVEVTTNGSIRTAKWWKNLGKIYSSSNLRLIFSVDGLEDTNHFYRVGLDFKKIIDNIKSFTSSGGIAIWKFIVFKHNEHQLAKAVDFSKELGVAMVKFDPGLLFRFNGQENWPVYIKGKQSHTISPTIVTEKTLHEYYTIHKPLIDPNNFITEKQDKVCPNLRNGHLYITHRHHVVPCCMYHNDLYEDYPGGKRIRQELILDIDTVDFSLYTLADILEKSVFFNNNLENHFKKTAWMPTCAKFCKTEIIKNLNNITQ